MDDICETTVPSLDIDPIVSIFTEMPVTLAVLYGSHARGESAEHSDVDFAVAFKSSLSAIERTRLRLQLIEQLSRVLHTDAVDVVPLSETPQSLRRAIQDDGIVLYGSKESFPPVNKDYSQQTHDDRMARFDEILTEIEQTV